MKVIMAKESLRERNGTARNTMPIDLVDQLNMKKVP
jgi:hypothetical protein